MKHLTDSDIAKMADIKFTPDDDKTRRRVRAELKLSQRIPIEPKPIPEHAILDLHHKTEEEAWNAIMNLAISGATSATIITGASGILHQKFPQWAGNSILTPHIISYTPINNGSFSVKFRRNRKKSDGNQQH